MPTKTIVIGEKHTKREKVPIELHGYLTEDMELSTNHHNKPGHFAFLELICKNYGMEDNTDLIFAYDNPNDRSGGVLFYGKWNDGVVE